MSRRSVIPGCVFFLLLIFVTGTISTCPDSGKATLVVFGQPTTIPCDIPGHCSRGFWTIERDLFRPIREGECNAGRTLCNERRGSTTFLHIREYITSRELPGYVRCRCDRPSGRGDSDPVYDVECHPLTGVCPEVNVTVGGDVTRFNTSRQRELGQISIPMGSNGTVTFTDPSDFDTNCSLTSQSSSEIFVTADANCYITCLHEPSSCSAWITILVEADSSLPTTIETWTTLPLTTDGVFTTATATTDGVATTARATTNGKFTTTAVTTEYMSITTAGKEVPGTGGDPVVGISSSPKLASDEVSTWLAATKAAPSTSDITGPGSKEGGSKFLISTSILIFSLVFFLLAVLGIGSYRIYSESRQK